MVNSQTGPGGAKPGAASASSVLDPAVIDHISSLTLVAQTVVEGFMSGQHRSPQKGSSVEFAQHREYVHGDQLRHIDWQIFARSDRLVVKEFVEETNFSCHLLLDSSESMAFTSHKWTKFDYARWCVSSLAYLIIRQRDAAGLATFDSKLQNFLPPTNGSHQMHTILAQLEATEPNGETGIVDALQDISSKMSRRGIVAIFSDFFVDIEALGSGLKRLRHAGHEPILFQVLDPQELEFDFDQLRRLDGLEGLGNIKVDPKEIRQAYREEIQKHQAELQNLVRELGCDFVPLTTKDSLAVTLSTYLARRSARARLKS